MIIDRLYLRVALLANNNAVRNNRLDTEKFTCKASLFKRKLFRRIMNIRPEAIRNISVRKCILNYHLITRYRDTVEQQLRIRNIKSCIGVAIEDLRTNIRTYDIIEVGTIAIIEYLHRSRH